jgi:hypothetical protein
VQKNGVFGSADTNGVGVQGKSQSGTGVLGSSTSGLGVQGTSESSGGVMGFSGTGIGVSGFSFKGTGDGVYGQGKNGVHGQSGSGGDSGVWGENTGGGHGVSGTSDAAGGIGVYGRGAKLAGRFDGNVEVTGDISLVNADCAEDFEMSGAGEIDPGSVVVIASGGALMPSDSAYDKRVAGVVSGAGDCNPGVILGRQQRQKNRRPVALVGKVYCKVDATYAPIEVGDLLTTSATPGHAMKAIDHAKAFGSVLGKALGPLPSGRGLLPVLVALQ